MKPLWPSTQQYCYFQRRKTVSKKVKIKIKSYFELTFCLNVLELLYCSKCFEDEEYQNLNLNYNYNSELKNEETISMF